jgi:hypothetical protein
VKYHKQKYYKYKLDTVEKCKVDLPGNLNNWNINKFVTLWDGIFTVKPGYAWDGPSGPTKDGKTNMTPSLFHDGLCQLMREGLLDRKHHLYVDKLFRLHLLKCGMSKFRAWYYYLGVRLRKKHIYPRKDEGRVIEVPSVPLIS